MKPIDKIKLEMIRQAIQHDGFKTDEPLDTSDSIATAYDAMWDYCSDIEYEFRKGQVETNIPNPGSRHYSSKSVAAKMSDGTWIGWTYWYGGGKHGDPGSVPWMEEAYELDCVEEEKLMTVRTFSKKETIACK